MPIHCQHSLVAEVSDYCFFSGWFEALVSVAWQVVEKDIVGSLSTMKETWTSL